MGRVLEVPYAGRVYRAAAVARWAIFLDSLGVRHREPDGFHLAPGLLFLPDFFLPEHGCWLHVQLDAEQQLLKRKCGALASVGAAPVFLFSGEIRPLDAEWFPEHPSRAIGYFGHSDGFVEDDEAYVWAEPESGSFVLRYEGKAAITPALRDAYSAASVDLIQAEQGTQGTPGFTRVADVLDGEAQLKTKTGSALRRAVLGSLGEGRLEGTETA